MIKPVVLIILDGWGIAPPGPGNATTLAKTPNIQSYLASFPHGKIQASGEAVGLPHNEKGNSETGHLNIGAGRIVYQDLPRINMAIADGSFFQIPAFSEAIDHARTNGSNLHLLGLIGQGGVHSSLEHLYALLRLCREQNFEHVFFHLFTDGRDSPPNSSLLFLDQIRSQIDSFGIGQVATLMGRYYAMDRDNRWERTEKAYNALTKGVGEIANDPKTAVNLSYQKGISDEFIEPIIFTDTSGIVLPRIKENDAVVFFNFRIDRPRQLTKSFVVPDFEKLVGQKIQFDPYAEKYFKKTYVPQQITNIFSRGPKINNLFFVTMTEYEKNLPVKVAFPPISVELTLGRILSERGLRQLRITESEKERFVSYYFNGQRELPFTGEERLIIPSPNVSTYDQQPAMSIRELTKTVTKKIAERTYDFILINFANPDMVGHTGVLEAGIKACEVVDECLGMVVRAVKNVGGISLVTADHGNIEEMINLQTGQVDTEHSANPVPLALIGNSLIGKNPTLSSGILADIAPTILKLLEINVPTQMSGRNLL